MNKISDINFDIKQLKSFLTVLSECSFTKASRQLKMGQATISHHIQQLEENLGVTLIIRSSKVVSATPEGILFKEFCDEFFNNLERLQSDLKKEVKSGKTEIAASTISSAYIIPGVIGNLKKKNPDFFYNTHVSDSREVLETVKEGRAEIGVLGKSVQHPQLVFEKVYSDTIVLISSGKPVGAIAPEDLRSIPMILREKGSGTRNAVEKALIAMRILPSELEVVYECSTTDSIKESVIAGLGFAFVSKLAISREAEAGVLKIINIQGLNIKRDFFVCYVQNRNLSKGAELFLQEMRKLSG